MNQFATLIVNTYRPYTCSTGSTPQCRCCFTGDRTEGGVFARAEDFEVKSLGSIRVTSPKLSSLFQQRNTWASISRSHYLLLGHTQTNTSKHVLDKILKILFPPQIDQPTVSTAEDATGANGTLSIAHDIKHQ